MKFRVIRNVWQQGVEMIFRPAEHIRLIVPRAALNVIFDECDRFDRDETGGRIVGTFKKIDENLTLRITGIIEPGPSAQRSAVSFFQDGEHQERIFREIERTHPDIEHLGNWHTHHCNGLSTLSGGDLGTYRRTVNHHNHNTDFFYALLVVAKEEGADRGHRYSVKHYIFRRDDERVYEIPKRSIEIVDTPLVWPCTGATEKMRRSSGVLEAPHHGRDETRRVLDSAEAKRQRTFDRAILAELYPTIRPFTSSKLGLYWRGSLDFLDGSKVEVVVVEDSSSDTPIYSILLRQPCDPLKAAAEELATQQFRSASSALLTAERTCNRALFDQREHPSKDKSS